MLVISRRVNEIVRIGDDIEIVVVRIGPDKVRLGISAPRGVTILREELVGRCDDHAELGGEGSVE